MMKNEISSYHISLLHELRQLPNETEWVEFKCNNDHPNQIGEYISALANAVALKNKANAYLIWGIEDITHQIVGTHFFLTQAKQGNENLENWLTRLLDPQIHFRFIEFDIDDNHISMIEIPRANHRPVQFQGIEYIRIGSYKKKLKDYPEQARALWKVFETTPFEQQVATERVDAAQVLSLLDYPAYFKLLNIPLPESRNGILARLTEDHMIESVVGGLWNILNLGAILFASELSKFRHLARKAVRVIEYEGLGRVKTKREHQGHKGYASGFEGLIGYLKGILPENEVIGEALRKSVPMYPELAIRELVANVILHQDFTITGTGPMIEIFDDRLEITNPGKSLIEPQRFLGTPPQSRNEALASFLRRVGICEERGSGIEKVVFQTELFQLPAPIFEVIKDHTRTVLFAHKTFVKMDKGDRIRACYLHACLQYVQQKKMTNATLRKRFGIDKKNISQVSRVISDAVNTKNIKSYNPGNESRRHASYVPYWA